ncbi:AraC family transcriptional regulator [Nocardia iowensis]|uniref:AraC family transcriptional regulator n=1 Tax=Nocardia iowensis TaxID=204891 RepID=A0ABX8RHN8_NOCIO|nr:AraC family transcriptional regulator [Nocardia iowensis]QXN88856.1 AraC family transcriptional regulator [Nocardia iowensis]
MTVAPLPKTCGDRRPVMFVRPSHVCYIGPDLTVAAHATSVAVLGVGLDAPLVFRAPGHGPTTTGSAFAPARAVHSMLASEGRIMLLFIDPAGTPIAPVAAAMRSFTGPFGFEHQHERELIAACDNNCDPGALLRRAGVPAPESVDPRIIQLAAAIRRDPVRVFHAEETAARLGLSASHFLRLFGRSTGTTFRRYQQWARLRQVVHGIAAGHDLSRCAVDAGFASPSHFSDTFRKTFGLSATAMLDSGVRFDLEMDDLPPSNP